MDWCGMMFQEIDMREHASPPVEYRTFFLFVRIVKVVDTCDTISMFNGAGYSCLPT